MSGAEGIRVSFSLVDLMQLNLVRTRLTTIAHADGLVMPEEIESIVDLLDDILGDPEVFRKMINQTRRRYHGGA